jgi:hypothetical protein
MMRDAVEDVAGCGCVLMLMILVPAAIITGLGALNEVTTNGTIDHGKRVCKQAFGEDYSYVTHAYTSGANKIYKCSSGNGEIKEIEERKPDNE